jgi:DNA-binding transcriptional LysR family regulator
MLINLELLRTFVAAAFAGTFREAAAQRHVTKSAVSQQIKVLETQLGVPLFERMGRTVRLTGPGARLAGALRKHFEAIEVALEEATMSQQEIAGEVRIGAPRPFGRIWLRPRLGKLLRAYPEIEVRVVFGTPTKLERKLADGELDFVILVREAELPGIDTRPLYREQFRAWAAPSYVSAQGSIESPEDAARHKFIVFDEDLPMHRAWWRAAFGARAPLRGAIACRVASLDEMLALAEDGLGIVVLPDYFVEDSAEGGRIVPAPLRLSKGRSPSAANTIFLAWRKGAIETARFRTVRDVLLP